MLLKTLKSNQAYQYILVPLMALALWIRNFLHPEAFVFHSGENQMLLYRPIEWLLSTNALADNVVALVFALLLSFLIQRLNAQYSLIRTRTSLAPALFILMTSGVPELHAMHPVYPAAVFLILSIDRIFNSFNKEKIHSDAFEAGFFLAVGALFYMELAFFFPLLWIGFTIVRLQVNWRDFVLTTIGFAIPVAAAVGYYLAGGQFDDLIQIIQTNIFTSQIFLREGLPIQIYAGYLVVLTILGSIFLLSQYDGKKISTRKYFKVFFWVFLISVTLIFVVPTVSQEMIILSGIPLSYLISNYFAFMKHQRWGEFLLYLLVAGVVTLQFF
jgi:hypothetical protein